MNDISQATELTVISRAVVSTILAADDTDILGKLADKVSAFRPDISTPRGRKEIASLASEVASSKMDLVRLANGLMESDRKRIAAILSERKIIEDRMDELKVQIRQPLTDFENAEKDRIKGHEDALARLVVHPDMERATSDELSAAIAVRHEPEARNWQEFHQRALAAQQEAIATLSRWRSAAQDREDQAAELARLRQEEAERQRVAAIQAQKEREDRIASEAAEAARKTAEAKAAREAREAEAKAAAIAIEAEKRAREMREAAAAAQARAERAEADRIEAEKRAEQARLVAAQKAEKDRLDAIEAERRRATQEATDAKREAEKRAENVAHKRSINRAAVNALVTVGLTEAMGILAVTAIATGSVPNVRIVY